MLKLSIIIPVYNCEKYIEDCIGSIIVSKKDFEIIIVDDGSIDSSGKLCDELEKKDKRIKVIHKNNGGVSSARNLGLEYTSGKYIMFVDADDVLTENWDSMIDFLKNDDIYYFNSFINTTSKINMLKYIIGDNEKGIIISGPVSKAFSSKMIEKNNMRFNENIINGEDMLFNINALLYSTKYSVIDFQFYLYRQMIGQSTKTFNPRVIESDMEFHRQLNKIFNDNNLDNKMSKRLEEFCIENAILLILNRISYIEKYKEAVGLYSFLEHVPYTGVLNKNNKKNIVLKLCKKKMYMVLFYGLKIKNHLNIILKQKKKGNFIEI